MHRSQGTSISCHQQLQWLKSLFGFNRVVNRGASTCKRTTSLQKVLLIRILFYSFSSQKVFVQNDEINFIIFQFNVVDILVKSYSHFDFISFFSVSYRFRAYSLCLYLLMLKHLFTDCYIVLFFQHCYYLTIAMCLDVKSIENEANKHCYQDGILLELKGRYKVVFFSYYTINSYRKH